MDYSRAIRLDGKVALVTGGARDLGAESVAMRQGDSGKQADCRYTKVITR